MTNMSASSVREPMFQFGPPKEYSREIVTYVMGKALTVTNFALEKATNDELIKLDWKAFELYRLRPKLIETLKISSPNEFVSEVVKKWLHHLITDGGFYRICRGRWLQSSTI